MDPKPSLEKVLCMKAGQGESSYAHNSMSVQIKMLEAAKPILERGIEENVMLKQGEDVFRIADLGCATGINTLLAADTIVRAVEGACIRRSIGLPEFQVYFADLPSNDFNSLLRSLPPCDQPPDRPLVNERPQHEEGQLRPPSRGYFAAAVSGSFYRRLFPRRTLHFVHSCMCLHWLSKVPERIQDKKSNAWNEGRIFVSNEAVAEAYLHQFNADLTAFLRCRAEEMVPGGCMLLAFLCRNSGDILRQDGLGTAARHLECAFHDMLTQGLIEAEVVDVFNIPFFAACADEFRSVVQAENSFTVQSLRVVGGLPQHPVSHVTEGQEHLFGKAVGNHYRALFESIVGAHLGSQVLVDELFRKMEERATERCQEYAYNRLDLIVAFLLRK